LRTLLKGLTYGPRAVITDKLAREGAALGDVLPRVAHRRHKGLNNRAKNAHQPTRERERRMRRFKGSGHARRFLAAYGPVAGYRETRTERFQTWHVVTGTTVVAGAHARTAATRPRSTALPEWHPNLTVPAVRHVRPQHALTLCYLQHRRIQSRARIGTDDHESQHRELPEDDSIAGLRVRGLFAACTPRGQPPMVLIARAARTATTVREMVDWAISSTLAGRERTMVSVGLKAVLVLKARKR
jgi:hypothetical protein